MNYEDGINVEITGTSFEQVHLYTRQFSVPPKVFEIQRLIFFYGHFNSFIFVNNTIKNCKVHDINETQILGTFNIRISEIANISNNLIQNTTTTELFM